MIGGLAVLLVASAIRIVPPLLGRERFGAEPTLALFAIGFSAKQIGQAMLASWRGRAASRRSAAPSPADLSARP